MADLKVGSTAGGSILWHQGNFPLKPVTNDVYYKTFKLYSEWNKPQAIDNDFVSKALGGEYLKNISFKEGFTFPDSAGYAIKFGPNLNTSTQGMYTASFRINDTFAIESPDGMPFILFDPDKTGYRLTVMGKVSGGEVWDDSGQVFSPGNTPSKAQVGLDKVVNETQVQLLTTATQEMQSVLSAPNFVSREPASRNEHVPRFDQIVVRDSIQDFGYYS